VSRPRRLAAAAAHFGRDLEESVDRVVHVIRSARDAGVELLALPDGALGGYLSDLRSPDPDSLPEAIDQDSPLLTRIAAAAGDLVVCLGYSEQAGADRFNAAVCLYGGGRLGSYRKVHQPPGEALVYASGSHLGAFDTPVGRLGLLIDYDKTFPEAARTVALDGAQIIACLSAWPSSRTHVAARTAQDRQSRLFDLYDSARAAENQVVWLSSNQTGRMGALKFFGQAKVVGPAGDVLARTPVRGGLAVADIDVETALSRARTVLHHLTELRPELYSA
jgi:predicted amidohydrolase